MTLVRSFIAHVLLLAGMGVSSASDAPSDPAAARQLWADFLLEYQTRSLKPLPSEEIDERARQELIQTAGARFRSWQADAKTNLPELAEAMSETDPSRPAFQRIEDALESLLPKIDRYGHYHRASDVSRLAEALKQNPGGVHMTLDRLPDGKTACYPLESGPAAQAGIGEGAILLAVDDIPAEGKSLSALRLIFVGPPESQIRIKVQQPHGKTEEFTMKRSGTPIPSVIEEKSPLGLSIRIRKFDSDTAAKVKKIAEENPEIKRLTLDLRGNAGGFRDEALKVTSLFFPEGTELGKWTGNQGEQIARDGNGISITAHSIRILEDGRTASAAEFLIAALREGLPGKVEIFGKKSYGKSHSTLLVPLAGGGQLVVTDALLATAKGFSWEQTGIEPDSAKKSGE